MTGTSDDPGSRPRPDVLVVGGGLIGLLLARELVRAGARVEVVDDAQKGAASPNAAGMIAPVAEGATDRDFTGLALRSRDLWRDLAPVLERESGASVDHDDSGALLPVLDADGRTALDRIRDLAVGFGESPRWVERPELDDLVPDLRPGIEQALLLPGEHRVDNRLATAAASESLRRSNVSIHRTAIAEVVTAGHGVLARGDGFERAAGAIVICGGAWTPSIRGLPDLPVTPVKGQMIAFDRVEWPFTGAIRTPDFYAVRRAGGRLFIGASVERTGFDLSLTDDAAADLATGAADLLPALAGREPVAHWAGLRPGTPDGWPIVGPLGKGLFVATGHFRNGILLAPVTAAILAPMVLGQGPDDPSLVVAPAMHPDRFTAAGAG